MPFYSSHVHRELPSVHFSTSSDSYKQPRYHQDPNINISSVPILASHQEGSQWNSTLSQLKHSIQQVKDDLGVGENDDESITDHSIFSRGDLSHSSLNVS